ncbi:Antitermination protein N [Escherichia coli]|nr:Antitermination protein N [Escherichia coli]
MLPSETMIWQPEFTDKTLSRKTGAVQLHRPTLSRAQIQAKGTHETPERIEDAKPIKFMAQDVIWQQKEYRRNLERAAIVYANEFGHKQPETGVCLPNVAIYAAGYRKSKQLTAR